MYHHVMFSSRNLPPPNRSGLLHIDKMLALTQHLVVACGQPPP